MAADRPDLLGAMTGAGATNRTGDSVSPAACCYRPLWTTRACRPECRRWPGQYLAVGSGRTRHVPWWQPPEPVLPLAPGAAVREALGTVMALAPPAAQLSADLSGGMDSTSLCFLAAREQPGLLTFRLAEADRDNEDAAFASQAAQSLSQARHMVTSQDEFPAMFADPARTSAGAGRPFRRRTRSRVAATRHGCSPGWVHGGILRDSAATSLRRFGRVAARAGAASPGHRHPVRTRLPCPVPLAAGRHGSAGMAHGGDIASWWRAQADNLTAVLPALPIHRPWAGGQRRCGPGLGNRRHHRCRPRHAARRRRAGTAARRRSPGSTRSSPSSGRRARPALGEPSPISSPNRGITSGSALPGRPGDRGRAGVRLYERASPWRYKPLLAEAQTSALFPNWLERAFHERRIQRGHARRASVQPRRRARCLRRLRAGRARPDRSRQATPRLLAPHLDLSLIFALQDLLACEVWLREVAACSCWRRRSDAAAPPS